SPPAATLPPPPPISAKPASLPPASRPLPPTTSPSRPPAANPMSVLPARLPETPSRGARPSTYAPSTPSAPPPFTPDARRASRFAEPPSDDTMIVGLEDDPFDAALMNTPVEALDVSPRVAPAPRAPAPPPPAPRAPVTSPPDAPRGRRTETARLRVPSLQEALAHATRALAPSARHPEARPLIGLGALAMIPIAVLIGFVGLVAGALIGASGEPTAKAAPKVAIAAP